MLSWIRRPLQNLSFRAGRFGARVRQARGGLVLCLHDVSDNEVDHAARPFSISVSMLDELVGWIKSVAEIVPLVDLLERPMGPSLRCALVFDDAGRSLLDHAAPALQRHDVAWAVAVPTGRVGRGYADPILRVTHALRVTRAEKVSVRWTSGAGAEPLELDGTRARAAIVNRIREAQFGDRHDDAIEATDSLVGSLPPGDAGRTYPEDLRIVDESELREFTRYPVTLLSHGHDHLPAVALDAERAVSDWKRSIDWLSSRFPSRSHPGVLVLPYGRLRLDHREALKDAGCRFLLTGTPGLYRASGDPAIVPRIPAHAQRVSAVAARIAGAARSSSR